MYGPVIILLFLGGLSLWIVCAIRMHRHGKSKGISWFFFMLFLMVVIDALLFLIIIVPVLNCTGFLCGIGEIVIFLICAGVLFIAFPIVMMTAMVSALKKRLNVNHLNENNDLLDSN